MFEELMPLLTQRLLVVTVSRVSADEICINIIPKSLKADQQNDHAALTTPLSVTGTPKELDEQLARQLVEFVETHLRLSSTLKNAKEQMEAAAKAAREAATKSTAAKSRSASGTKATLSAAQVQPEAATTENSDDSQSGSALTQVTSVSTDVPGDGSTGSLFDVKPKDEN